MSCEVLPFGMYHGLSVQEIAMRDPAYLGILMYSDWFRSFDIYDRMVDDGYLRFSPYVKAKNIKSSPIALIMQTNPLLYEYVCNDLNYRSNNSALDLWLKEHRNHYVEYGIKKDLPSRDVGDIEYL
ncbi:MAG: hypothetical protein ACR2IJ_06095 [Fluviibacter sp.]